MVFLELLYVGLICAGFSFGGYIAMSWPSGFLQDRLYWFPIASITLALLIQYIAASIYFSPAISFWFGSTLLNRVLTLLVLFFILQSCYRLHQGKGSKLLYLPFLLLLLFTVTPLHGCHEGWGRHCHFLWSGFHWH